MNGKNVADASAAASAGASIWLTLDHISIVVGLIAGFMSIAWYIWRFWKHSDNP